MGPLVINNVCSESVTSSLLIQKIYVTFQMFHSGQVPYLSKISKSFSYCLPSGCWLFIKECFSTLQSLALGKILMNMC